MNILVRFIVVVSGVLVVLAGALIDFEALGNFVIPFWVYLAAHFAILAAFLNRGAFSRLALALPVFALTIPVACLGMSSLGHRLFQIKPGMTVAQTRQLMAGFKEGTGLTNPYSGGDFIPEGCVIFRDPRHSESNSAWGTVVIQNNRVTEVWISPD